ncbi:MAG: hypothetical protein R2809_05065 [Flavobacteriales bacterium]
MSATKFTTWVLLMVSIHAYSQTTFWTEDFGTGCNQGQFATNYISPNGIWLVTPLGINETGQNFWFVSAAENGNEVGECGTGCGDNQTLHLGVVNTFVGNDLGASYYEGLFSMCDFVDCGSTDKRVESPVIDCSNYSSMTLHFTYIEGGNDIDNATLWLKANSGWVLIDDMAKTFSATCAPQGVWTEYQIALPSWADNASDLQFGIRWINNDDADATDPSFAIDNISLEGTFENENSDCCDGDFNCDGVVGVADMILFISQYGCINSCFADLTNDGVVGAADLIAFSNLFGTVCP